MNEYAVGNLVEASKGEDLIRSRVSHSGGEPGITTGLGFIWLSSLKADGWQFKTIEKAAPKLPTEPGVYVGSMMGDVPMWLTEEGKWFTVKTQCYDPARHAPFTRLEPVAVTAKRVIDRLEELANTANFTTLEDDFETARKDFGVTP